MSSVNEKTRQQMRETHGLVDSLVTYIKASLDESKTEDKVRQDQMELDSSCCFTPRLVYLFVCVCVFFLGAGKFSVCLEEPLLPALQ